LLLLSFASRDSRWYYGIIQMLWLLALVMATVFTSGNVAMQLLLYQLLLLINLALLLLLSPLRFPALKNLDLLVVVIALANGLLGLYSVMAGSTGNESLTSSALSTPLAAGKAAPSVEASSEAASLVAVGVLVLLANLALVVVVVAMLCKQYSTKLLPLIKRCLGRVGGWLRDQKCWGQAQPLLVAGDT
jgi:hypothetical protein